MHSDIVTVGEAMALLIALQPGPLDAVSAFERVTAGVHTRRWSRDGFVRFRALSWQRPAIWRNTAGPSIHTT